MDHAAVTQVSARRGYDMRCSAFHITQRNNARRIVHKNGSGIAITLFEKCFYSAAFSAICRNDLFIEEVIIDKLVHQELFSRDRRREIGAAIRFLR